MIKTAITQNWIRKKLNDPNVTFGTAKDIRKMWIDGMRKRPLRPKMPLSALLGVARLLRGAAGYARDPGSRTSPIVVRRDLRAFHGATPQERRVVYAHEKAHRVPLFGRSELFAWLAGADAAKLRGAFTPEFKRKLARGSGMIGGSQDEARIKDWVKRVGKRLLGEK